VNKLPATHIFPLEESRLLLPIVYVGFLTGNFRKRTLTILKNLKAMLLYVAEGSDSYHFASFSACILTKVSG
jgi:hypothetical protein